jgi:hypothetical protein
MKYLIAFIWALFLTACATSPRVQEQIKPSPWQLMHAGKSYETKFPGMGASRRYVHPLGLGWADIYSYDLKRADWVSGVSDPKFASEFSLVIYAVHHQEGVGKYKNMSIGEPKDVIVKNLMFRTVSFKYDVDGKTVNSSIYLTAIGGKLLKYRISIDKDSKQNIDDLAVSLIAESLPYLKELFARYAENN